MKKLWAAWAARLDARTERERIFLFAAGAVVVLTLAYVTGIEPALKTRALLRARMADQERLIDAAQAQKNELLKALQQDPNQALHGRIAQARSEIGAIDARLAGLQQTLVSAERMPQVLQALIGQDARVQLVSLRNLPAVPLLDKQDAGSAARAAAGTDKARSVDSAPRALVYRHGVEVVVQGSYPELLAYVARLEQQPWRVYWGKTVLTADYPKALLTLTLYTLSLDHAWLSV